MNKVEQDFSSKGIKRGKTIYYSKIDTLNFILECQKHQIEILGIDGLFITDTTTQPSLEDSIDFTAFPLKLSVINRYDKAFAFVKSRGDDMYFDIVCG